MHAVTQATKHPKKQPARTCVGCRAEDRPESMVRIVLDPEGGVVVDLAGRAFGRGSWVHATPKCLSEAAPRGLSKSFKTQITTGASELRRLIAEAADRRAVGLITAAKGAGRLAFGSSSVREALKQGTARLVVVATDARAAAQTDWVERAVSDGHAVAWSTKQRLGEILNRPDTGVLAVLDTGIAATLSQTVAMIHMPEPEVRKVRRTDASREDG